MNEHFRFQRVATSLAVAALAGSAMTVQAGSAAEAESAVETESAQTAYKHCVTELEPLAAGQQESASKQIGCFPTFAAAISAATGGAVTLSADATPESLKGSDLGAAAARIIGVDYQLRDYRGLTQTWVVSNSSGCSGGYLYSANTPSAFNNRLSSTRAFAGCNRNISFQLAGLGGLYKICKPDCSYIGDAMDNRTSSKLWID